jgi:hypothetical protein
MSYNIITLPLEPNEVPINNFYYSVPGPADRDPQISEDEMRKASLRIPKRDYCAYLLVHYHKCRVESRINLLNRFKCMGEKHLWEACRLDEYVPFTLYPS